MYPWIVFGNSYVCKLNPSKSGGPLFLIFEKSLEESQLTFLMEGNYSSSRRVVGVFLQTIQAYELIINFYIVCKMLE